MKYMHIILVLSGTAVCLGTAENNPLAIEHLFPSSPSKYVLDTCMQVCSDLVQLDSVPGEQVSSFWMDALLGKMIRLQAGIDRLMKDERDAKLHADDLVYLLAMINRVDVAYESVQCEAEYQVLCHTLLHTIKGSLARLLTKVYTQA